MMINKTWATVQFMHGNAYIEATMNYETKSYSLTHGSNDQNVTFKTGDIQNDFDRCKCVKAALDYIKKELDL